MAKKKPKPGPMTVKGAKVMAECAFATAQGLQAAMGERDYTISPEARSFWLELYARTIRLGLKQPNADWEGSDRDDVIPRSRDLGRIAGELALAGGSRTGVVLVAREHAKSASDKVSKDRRCRAARRLAKAGAGGYCDIGGR